MASKLTAIRLQTSAPQPTIASVVPSDAAKEAHIGIAAASLAYLHLADIGPVARQCMLATMFIGAVSSSREAFKECVQINVVPAAAIAVFSELGLAIANKTVSEGDLHDRLKLAVSYFADVHSRAVLWSHDSDDLFELRKWSIPTLWIGVGLMCFFAGRQPIAGTDEKIKKCGTRNLRSVGIIADPDPKHRENFPFIDSKEYFADEPRIATTITAWQLMTAFRHTAFRILALYAMAPAEPTQAYIGGPVFDMQWTEMAYVPMVRDFLNQFPKAQDKAALKSQIAKFQAGETKAASIDEEILPFCRLIMGSRFTVWTRREMPLLVEIARLHHKKLNPDSSFFANAAFMDMCVTIYDALVAEQEAAEKKAFGAASPAEAGQAIPAAQTTAQVPAVPVASASAPVASAAQPGPGVPPLPSALPQATTKIRT